MMATETSSSPRNSSGSGAAAHGLSPLLIAAAILLPPLAVFLLGGVSRNFWIAFALTCLGYLPGAAFALFVLLKSRAA